MKDETRVWLIYAEENLKASYLLLEQNLYNPCLQNTQQSIEKGLKALLLENNLGRRKTHSIAELVCLLVSQGVNINLSEDDRDLFDSIYLPSKYPLGGILPDFEPDAELCQRCVLLAEGVFNEVRELIVGEEYK